MSLECKYARAIDSMWEYGIIESNTRVRQKKGTAKTLQEALKRNHMAPLEGNTCSGKHSAPSFVPHLHCNDQ